MVRPRPDDALQLSDFHEGLRFLYVDINGKEQACRVVFVQDEVVVFAPYYATTAYTGYLDECSLTVQELGLQPFQTEDGPQWMGYCLRL